MDRNNSAKHVEKRYMETKQIETKHIEEIEKIAKAIDDERKAFEESCSFLRYHWKGSNADAYIKKAATVESRFEEVTGGLNKTVKSMRDSLANR